MKIKIRAFDEKTNKMITEESSGLKSSEILKRYDAVMLSTDYKDKHGSEIYDGDILNAIEPKRNFTVSFKDGSFQVSNKMGEIYRLSTLLKKREVVGFTSEIIGNIYETPEI